jgi:diguanylate cyclase (GGDEF)-like protein/PAS domain S-box-containing protein
MKFLQSSFGRPYSASLSLRQFGWATVTTLLGVGVGWLLLPWLGVTGAYLPLLASVGAATWLGGLWPSLFSQVFGACATLFFTGHWVGKSIGTADLYAVLLFLVIAKLLMFLLLHIRLNRYLRQNKAHLETIAQATHDSLWEWDFATNRVWRGGKTDQILGCVKEEIKYEFNWWLKRIHPADEDRVRNSLRHAIDSGENRWSSEYRLRRNDGSFATVSDHGFIIRDKKGRGMRMFGGTADISAQRRAEEHLAHSAFHDSLTGLPNRDFLLAQLDRLLRRRRYKEDGSSIAVLFIDVDRFKVVNDSLGRRGGDQVLIEIASRITRCLDQNDIAARFSGDEFVAVLSGIKSSAEAVHMAEKIQQSITVPFEAEGQSIKVSASVGISFAESLQAEEAIRQADLAMYQAKAQGRARFQIFEQALEVRARSALQAETELRRSFEDGSLRLHYQPIISLIDGNIYGFEALLRWHHPERGLIKPLKILAIAEESGLLTQLGQWVLHNSCMCLARWKQNAAATPLRMSFNLSGSELTRPDLVEEVQSALQDARLDGGSLIIELTETAIMESDERAPENLKRLTDLGIQLAIDDFGRGYSSLSRLQDFPVSMLKVDSSFVSQIGTNRPQILDAIMALAHELRLEIVAEGVETNQQLQYLQERGAALAQGLLFSDALPEQIAFDLLTQQKSLDLRGGIDLDSAPNRRAAASQ